MAANGQNGEQSSNDKNSGSAVDLALASRVEDCADRRVPWIVKCAQDSEQGSFQITFEEKLRPVDDYLAPADIGRHVLGDPESLVAYMSRYGKADKSLIFYNSEGMVGIVDDKIANGQRSRVTAPFVYSNDFLKWAELVNHAHAVGHLKEIIPGLSHTLTSADLYASLNDIKYNEQVHYDTEVNEAEGKAHYGVMFSVEGKDGSLKKIPRSITIVVPVLAADLLNEQTHVRVEIKILLVMPKARGEPLKLYLGCPTLEVMKQRRIKDFVQTIVDGLGQTEQGQPWLVLRGKDQWDRVVLGAGQERLPTTPRPRSGSTH